jgi:hypothetical protein
MSEFAPYNPYIPSYASSGLSGKNTEYSGINSPPNIDFGTDDKYWNAFFEYICIKEENYQNYSSTDGKSGFYQELFADYWQGFGNIYGTPGTAGSRAVPSSVTVEEWNTYMQESSLGERVWSPFMWMFKILLDLMPEIQQATVNDSNLSYVLTNAQLDATNAMSEINFQAPSSSSPTITINPFQTEANQNYQIYMQLYLGWSAVVQSEESTASNNVNSSNQAFSQINSLMTSLIQQMQSILSLLFT